MVALSAGYYASYDSTVSSPSPVTGWYDTFKFVYKNMPTSENLISLTSAEWNARLSGSWAVTNGSLVQIQPTLPLSVQVGSAINKISTSATSSITNGVPVSVNGQSYTLSGDNTSQLNMLASAVSILGVMMSSGSWTATTSISSLTVVKLGSIYIIATTGGTTGSTAPTAPTTCGSSVTDGTVVWELFGVLVAVEPNGTVWMSPDEFFSAFSQANYYVTMIRQQYHSIVGQLRQPGITETQVASTQWPSNL